MTVDERIEALTQSAELLSRMHQDNEKTCSKLFAQLAAIAESRENRITRLEEDSNG